MSNDKKEKWYMSDWTVSFMAVAVMAATAVANYYYHGGHIVW